MIRTLVVEDDPLAAEAHAHYVGRMPGFQIVGVSGTAADALATIRASLAESPIDLVLLDMNLPDGHGVDLARRLRSAGIAVDIIAITAVRDIDVVHTAMSMGVVQYLIKPFSFATFAAKLETYRDYRRRLEGAPSSATQSDVDRMLAALRAPSDVAMPKGLSSATLETIVDHLRAVRQPLSAAELAETLQLSRVTARRYLEHLAERGQISRTPRYGTPGRPELEYRWLR
jgi:response regulator of citrate/malate metabolism